ncbi:hypothetical protein COP1_030414 [Malus domestica]
MCWGETEAPPPGQNPVDHDDQTADDDPSSTVPDLTSFRLHDLDSVELPPSLIELDLMANRLTGLDPRIATLSKKALFSSEPHRKRRCRTDLRIFTELLVFDVSFNEITSLHGLSKVTSTLKELYVSKNELTKIEEIEHLHDLHILELGLNRLRVMENL